MKEVASLNASKERRGKTVKGSVRCKPLIAFIYAAICYVLLLAISRVFPLGRNSILLSDLEAQYAPFLFMYRNMLLSASSVKEMLYSFSMGMGKNMAGTFGYYLASPLNLLILLFRPEQTSEFIAFIIGLKMSVAAAFMCLFIDKRSEKGDSKWSILFGVMYAFSSYFMLYMFNIMWLDGYALLPLALYFTEKFMEEGRKAGLMVTLLLLFLSNYYIAYMVGIYMFFYLLVRLHSKGIYSDRKAAWGKIIRFITAAVLCALIMCVILLPVGIDTIANADPVEVEKSEDFVGFTFTGFLDQIFLGTDEDFLSDNLPYIFISVFVTYLCTLFFVSASTEKKEKKTYGFVFAGVYAVFLINAFDVAWQAFDTPNWFFHRESFVFYPLFLVVAHKMLERIKQATTKEFLKAGGILTVLLFAAQSFSLMKDRERIFLCNLCLIAAFTGLSVLLRKDKWHEQLKDMPKIVPALVYILVTTEVVFFAPIMSAGRAVLSLNTRDGAKYADSIRAIEELSAVGNDGSSFRVELEQASPELKPYEVDDVGSFYAGYNGISFFNSSSNKNLHRFIKQFGFTVNYNYFTAGYTFASPDTDAFFSIGHTMTRSPYTAADPVVSDTHDNDLTLYRNRNVLPLAFPVDQGAFGFDIYALETATEQKDYLSFRNSFYASLFPDSFTEDFYIPIEGIEPTYINCENINVSDYITADSDEDEDDTSSQAAFDADTLGTEAEYDQRDDIISLYKINEELPVIIDYEIPVETDKELYLNVSTARCLSDCTVYVDGRYFMRWDSRSFYSGVVRLGSFEPGQVIHVSIVSEDSVFRFIDINFAYLDNDIFEEQFGGIDISGVTVNKVVNGHVEITSDLTDDRVILTTIPYEKGWTLKIDGQPADIKVYQGALIGIDCGPGHHDIELDFTPPGTKTGAMLSAIGIVGTLLFVLADKKKKTPQKKA